MGRYRTFAVLALSAVACATRDARREASEFWCTVAPVDGVARDCFRSRTWCEDDGDQCETSPSAFCTAVEHPHGGPAEFERCYPTRAECENERRGPPCVELEPDDPPPVGVKPTP